MFTERKALAMIFEDLAEEKRQLKANYRSDMADIDKRIQQVLDRVQRLDDIEREAVDVEGTLHQLAATTKELAALIPQVDVGDVIEAAAAKMVDVASMENAAQIHASEPQPQDTQLPLEKMHGIKRPTNPREVMEIIEGVIKSKPYPLNVRDIERELKERYGWEWGAFSTSFSGWRSKIPNSIEKKGLYYSIKNTEEGNQDEQSTESLQPEAATV